MTCFTRNIDMKSHEAMEIVGCAFRWLRFGYGLKTSEEELGQPQGARLLSISYLLNVANDRNMYYYRIQSDNQGQLPCQKTRLRM